MADVFISYHEKTEGAIASEIAAALENAGISCWYAKRDVSAGNDFAHEVVTQIENCKIFLLLLDEGASHSPHVETEVGNAFGRLKKIIPYQTDKKNVKHVPWVQYYLKQVQIVPLPNYNTLVEEIATVLGRFVKTPEPQLADPRPKMVAPETKAEYTIFIDGVISAFVLICIIGLSISGFNVGRQTEVIVAFNELFDIELSNFLSGVLGTFAGCFVGWAVSITIMGFIKSVDKSIANDLYYANSLIMWTLRILFFISFILGAIISYKTEPIIGVRFFFLFWILAGFIGKLSD